MDPDLLIVALVILALVAVALFVQQRQSRTHHLQRHFGPEYGRGYRSFFQRLLSL